MKLIILNGTGGAGKTTVSKKLHEQLPLSVRLPNYELRRMVSGFKDRRAESAEIIFRLMVGMVREALAYGSDVILDSKIHDNFSGNSVIDEFIALGNEFGAEVYEIILDLDKETAIERMRGRGLKNGLLTEENVVRNGENFYNNMQKFISSRSGAIVIDVNGLDEEAVLKEVRSVTGV